MASPARQRLKQKLQKEIEDVDTFILPTAKHQNLSALLLLEILALDSRYERRYGEINPVPHVYHCKLDGIMVLRGAR